MPSMASDALGSAVMVSEAIGNGEAINVSCSRSCGRGNARRSSPFPRPFGLSAGSVKHVGRREAGIMCGPVTEVATARVLAWRAEGLWAGHCRAFA